MVDAIKAGGRAPDYRPRTEPEGTFIFLTEREVAGIFSPGVAIQSQREAFAALGGGTAVLPDKLMVTNTRDGSVAFCYAARLSPGHGAVSKFGSVNPSNTDRSLPSISALIVMLDAETGRLSAVMDGTVITTRRTAAASAAAADTLARTDASSLAVLGCGVQGREHVRMLTRVRRFETVRVWDRDPHVSASVARQLAQETGLAVGACKSAEDAVRGADLVVACTLSTVPVVEGKWVAPGATVISIGSIEPDRCEVDQDLVRRAGLVVVDDPDTAAHHAGPIVLGLRTGELQRSDLIGLGEILVGSHAGRPDTDAVIYYNSTGIGVQDAAAAQAVLAVAERTGVGERRSIVGEPAVVLP
ncbi:MAG: ornithine cyclodeaminase [Marmoricola sp.]|nr:ornithine cyclodeaminase [Marmoricola sp.]